MILSIIVLIFIFFLFFTVPLYHARNSLLLYLP